jgi:Mg-chelatase subunit ChlD
MNKKSNGSSKFVITASSTLFLLACGQQTPEQQAKAENVSIVDEKTYAFRGADQSWPGDVANDSILATNLHAKNFYIIVDGSGSMKDTSCGNGRQRIDVAKDSINQFFEALPNDTNTGLYIFDERGPRQAISLQATNIDGLKNAVNRMKAGSKTPLGKSIGVGYAALTEQAKKQQGYGEYNLVIITDGAASDTSLMFNKIDEVMTRSPVNIHTIGFCLEQGHSLNQPGRINYKSAFNSSELKSVLAEAESFDTTTFEGS